ncbi:hypothetical protein GCM10011419_30180 [Vogesella fluminis]|uniref:Uncharacterized protein n=1 Tax=Vogesella fluminis TaxID=1069161 RepID=A0ABQ2WD00_9NEIS|nr:hypothetical protein GCM10011419_30180 [Vogesella fluminis]
MSFECSMGSSRSLDGRTDATHLGGLSFVLDCGSVRVDKQTHSIWRNSSDNDSYMLQLYAN